MSAVQEVVNYVLTPSCSVVFLIFLMSVLKASSVLALYCNVFGHVPLWECRFSAFKASWPLIVLLFFLLKVLHCSGVFGSNFF